MLGQNYSREFIFWSSVKHPNKKTAISNAHKRIVFDAKQKGYNDCLILEDDVKFLNNKALSQFISHKPENFDIYLGGASSIKYTDRLLGFTGLHCYIINRSFYDKFLNSDESLNIDFALTGKGKYYIHYPMLAIQQGEHLEKYWQKVNNKLDFLNKKKDCIFG